MKATELRIGNTFRRDDYDMTVYHIEKRYENAWKVNDLDIDFDDQIQVDKLCSPISLDESWLVKFGFKKPKNRYEFLFGDGEEHTKLKFSIRLKNKVQPFNDWYISLSRDEVYLGYVRIDYVHQLQNLYFALTGQELKNSRTQAIMILSFSKDAFVLGIKTGVKIHTIREDAGDRWKSGRKIHFWKGNPRNVTKNPYQFMEGECKSVQKIFIHYNERLVNIDGRIISREEVDELAIADGFENTEEFFKWFGEDFNGKLIHWTDKVYIYNES